MIALLFRGLTWPLRFLVRLWDRVDMYLTRWQSVLYTFRLLLIAFAIWLPGYLLEMNVGIPGTRYMYLVPDIRGLVGIPKPMWPVTGFWFYVGIFTFVMGMCRFRGNFFSRFFRSLYCTSAWMFVLILAMEVWSRWLFGGHSIFDVGAHRRVIIGWHTNAYWPFPIGLWLFLIVTFWILLFWKVAPYLLVVGFKVLKFGKLAFIAGLFFAHGYGLHWVWNLFAGKDSQHIKEFLVGERPGNSAVGMFLDRREVPFFDLIDQLPLPPRIAIIRSWEFLWFNGWTIGISVFLGLLVFVYMRVHGGNASNYLLNKAQGIGHNQRREDMVEEAKKDAQEALRSARLPVSSRSQIQEVAEGGEGGKGEPEPEPEMTMQEAIDELGRGNLFVWLQEKIAGYFFDRGKSQKKRRRVSKGKGSSKGGKRKTTGTRRRTTGTGTQRRRPGTSGAQAGGAPRRRRPAAPAASSASAGPPSLADLPEPSVGMEPEDIPAPAPGPDPEAATHTDPAELRDRFRRVQEVATGDPFGSNESLEAATGIQMPDKDDQEEEGDQEEESGSDSGDAKGEGSIDPFGSNESLEAATGIQMPDADAESGQDDGQNDVQNDKQNEEDEESSAPVPAASPSFASDMIASTRRAPEPDLEEPVSGKSEESESEDVQQEESVPEKFEGAEEPEDIPVPEEPDDIQESEPQESDDIQEPVPDLVNMPESASVRDNTEEREGSPSAPALDGSLDDFMDDMSGANADYEIETKSFAREPVQEEPVQESAPEEPAAEENLAEFETDSVGDRDNTRDSEPASGKSGLDGSLADFMDDMDGTDYMVQDQVSVPETPVQEPVQEPVVPVQAPTPRTRAPAGPVAAPRIPVGRSTEGQGGSAEDPLNLRDGLPYHRWVALLPGDVVEDLPASVLNIYPDANRWDSVEWSQWQNAWLANVFQPADDAFRKKIVEGRLWGDPGADWLALFISLCKQEMVYWSLVPDLVRIYGRMPNGE